jgi:hypothetical protein
MWEDCGCFEEVGRRRMGAAAGLGVDSDQRGSRSVLVYQARCVFRRQTKRRSALTWMASRERHKEGERERERECEAMWGENAGYRVPLARVGGRLFDGSGLFVVWMIETVLNGNRDTRSSNRPNKEIITTTTLSDLSDACHGPQPNACSCASWPHVPSRAHGRGTVHCRQFLLPRGQPPRSDSDTTPRTHHRNILFVVTLSHPFRTEIAFNYYSSVSSGPELPNYSTITQFAYPILSVSHTSPNQFLCFFSPRRPPQRPNPTRLRPSKCNPAA